MLFAKLYGMLPDIYEQNAEKVRELLRPLGWTLRVINRRGKKFAYAHRRLSREVIEEQYLATLDDLVLTRIAALAESSTPKMRTELKTGLCYERLNRTKSLVVCGCLSSAGK